LPHPPDNIWEARRSRRRRPGVSKAPWPLSTPAVRWSPPGARRRAATLEALTSFLEGKGIQLRYGLPSSRLTNIERELIDMEIMLRSTWLAGAQVGVDDG
jgi:hypothetical protein